MIKIKLDLIRPLSAIPIILNPSNMNYKFIGFRIQNMHEYIINRRKEYEILRKMNYEKLQKIIY